MMKIFISIILSINIYAAKGVVKALEAPLLASSDESSRILMNKRKGELIYIHDTSISDNSLYYKTLTLDGTDSYVLKEYVKVIYGNLKELDNNIAYEKDPTNYIIDEPIPDDYPFRGFDRNKAHLQFAYSQSVRSNYEYTTTINRQQINNAIGMRLKYLTNPDFDETNRFYYGFHFGGQTNKNEYQLEDDNFSSETSSHLAIGPIVSYTYYRNETFEIDTGIELGFNLHRKFVEIEDLNEDEKEERTFLGASLNGSIFTTFVHKNSFDSRQLDITHGPAVEFNSPYTLNASSDSVIKRFWNSDQIKVSSEFIFSYNVGITYRF